MFIKEFRLKLYKRMFLFSYANACSFSLFVGQFYVKKYERYTINPYISVS